MKGRTQTALLIRDIVGTAPEVLKTELTGLTTPKLAARAARLRPGPTMTPLSAAKHSLSHLGRRWLFLDSEVDALDAQLVPLLAAYARACVGPDTAGALLVAAGDNPERLRSERCFAKICGVSPLPASSGRIVRHRLNQGGNREANSALWRIVLVRLHSHQTNPGLHGQEDCRRPIQAGGHAMPEALRRPPGL